LHLHLPAQDAPLIEYLAGSLDEGGYLDHGVLAEAARLFAVPLPRVQSVLDVLQAQEPGGIGARDVQECLLLQLQRLEVDSEQRAVMAHIITDHLTLLGQGRYREMARQLGIPRARVEAACALVKQHLTPFPLRGYLGPDLQAGERPTSTLVPDVIICRRSAEEGGGYEVEIAEAERFGLSINPAYLQAAHALRGSRDASARHVQEHLARTRLFMTTVKRRWDTLDSITCCLIELQPDLLKEGRGALHPLTRAQVAKHLGLHASTISRATSNKYVMPPTAEVVPFSLFFESIWSVKAVVKEIISRETRPLSDQQVTELLQARGILVARRTVAKYREQLGALPSSLRRVAAAQLSSAARPAGKTCEQPFGGRRHATRSLN
jgi:RNA polymerase sigma-54 factor